MQRIDIECRNCKRYRIAIHNNTVVYCAHVRGVHPMGDEARCFIEILGGSRRIKIGDQPINGLNNTKFGQLIIRKIVKIIATGCHILKRKCTKL